MMQRPVNDGGQWDMMVNLINKHGLMPKKNFPESVSSESSAQLNAVLTSKVMMFLYFSITCRYLLSKFGYYTKYFFTFSYGNSRSSFGKWLKLEALMKK